MQAAALVENSQRMIVQRQILVDRNRKRLMPRKLVQQNSERVRPMHKTNQHMRRTVQLSSPSSNNKSFTIPPHTQIIPTTAIFKLYLKVV